MEKIETMESFWRHAEEMTEGILFAMLTDEIVFERWPLDLKERKDFAEKEGRLLDVRIFNEDQELRMFRGDIGRKLQGRLQNDKMEDPEYEEYFDEEQYLDIDSKRSGELFRREGKVRSTGGGCYRLPLDGFNDAKIQIRNYLGYYEATGQAYVKDWRLVKLFKEGR